jgi:ABC-type polar amino acid transport system ATPase subunit
MVAVIEVEGLRKEYRRFRKPRTVALDGLDLEVPEGGVFGFLGPNGAGKTTTIRCLLGLVAASAGHARVLGGDVPASLPRAIRRIVRALRPMWSPWLLGDNMVAFASWMATNFQVSASESYTITPAHGVLVIGLYTAALVAVGFAFVRIRDVQ